MYIYPICLFDDCNKKNVNLQIDINIIMFFKKFRKYNELR